MTIRRSLRRKGKVRTRRLPQKLLTCPTHFGYLTPAIYAKIIIFQQMHTSAARFVASVRPAISYRTGAPVEISRRGDPKILDEPPEVAMIAAF